MFPYVVDWFILWMQVDHCKTLRELGITEDETLTLRRKYFFSDSNVDSRDPVQLSLIYVQVRNIWNIFTHNFIILFTSIHNIDFQLAYRREMRFWTRPIPWQWRKPASSQVSNAKSNSAIMWKANTEQVFWTSKNSCLRDTPRSRASTSESSRWVHSLYDYRYQCDYYNEFYHHNCTRHSHSSRPTQS